MKRLVPIIAVMLVLFLTATATANPLYEVTRLKKQALFSEAWKSSEQGVKYWKNKIREDLSNKTNLGELYAARVDLAAILGKDDDTMLREALKAVLLTPKLSASSSPLIHPRARNTVKIAKELIKTDAEKAFTKARAKENQGAYCEAWTLLTPYAEHVSNTSAAKDLLNRVAIKCGTIQVPRLAYFDGDPGGSDLSFIFRKPHLVVLFPIMRKGANLPPFTKSIQTHTMLGNLKGLIRQAQVKQLDPSDVNKLKSRLSTKDLRSFVRSSKLQISFGDLLSDGKVRFGELSSTMAQDVQVITRETGADIVVFVKFLTGGDPEKRAKMATTLYHRDRPKVPLFMDSVKFGKFQMEKQVKVLESNIGQAANQAL